jgi:hypothetical protein
VTIGRDPIDRHYSYIETGMHKESGCIFKIEVETQNLASLRG